MITHAASERTEPSKFNFVSLPSRGAGSGSDSAAVASTSVAPSPFDVEEESLAERALGKSGAAAYARLVSAEREVRSSILQSRREELLSVERQLESRDGIVCEGSVRVARGLGKQLYRKLMIHRQPTHRDNSAAQKVAERMGLRAEEEGESKAVAETQPAARQPPRPGPRRTEHPTHVIPLTLLNRNNQT